MVAGATVVVTAVAAAGVIVRLPNTMEGVIVDAAALTGVGVIDALMPENTTTGSIVVARAKRKVGLILTDFLRGIFAPAPATCNLAISTRQAQYINRYNP